jgi:hypothetical protein
VPSLICDLLHASSHVQPPPQFQTPPRIQPPPHTQLLRRRRIVLLSEEGNETHIFELGDDDELSRAMSGVRACNSAHRTVFKQNQLFVTSDYVQRCALARREPMAGCCCCCCSCYCSTVAGVARGT